MAFLHTIQLSLADWSSWIWPRVATHLLESTAFLLCGLVAAALLKRSPGRARYYVWLMAMAKFAVPSVLLLVLAIRTGVDFSSFSNSLRSHLVKKAAVASSPSPIVASSEKSLAKASASPSLRAARLDPYTALSAIWLSGFLVIVGLWVRARRKFWSAVWSGAEMSQGAEAEALARACVRLGMRRRIRLMISPCIHSPVVGGVLRPVLVLPEGVASRLNDEGMQSILMHELVHVRYWDNMFGNLQMFLCALFWFHPLIWLLDRKLIVERERACDLSVARLSSPTIYAESVLAVCRLCIGSNVAGVSAAAGADIQRRVKEIMASHPRKQLSLAQDLVVGSILVWLPAFSLLCGIFNNQELLAESRKPAAHQASAPAAAQANDTTPALTPRPVGAPALTRERVAALDRKISAAPMTAVRFENVEGAPVQVLSASVKIVPVEHGLLITPPVLSLTNNTGKQITALRADLRAGNQFEDNSELQVDIAPRASYVLQPEWRRWYTIVESIHPEELVAGVIAVRFDDGNTWGNVLGVPGAMAGVPRPETSVDVAPKIASAVENPSIPEPSDAQYIPARFINPKDAPLSIYRADTRREQPGPDATYGTVLGSGTASYLPVVTLTNNTNWRIVAIKLRFKADVESHSVTAIRADIEPHGTYIFKRNSVMAGSPENMHVEVLGVEFADGSVWGAMDSEINGRDLWIDVPQSISKPHP